MQVPSTKRLVYIKVAALIIQLDAKTVKKKKKSDFGAKRVRRGIMAAVGKGKLEKYASYQSSDDDTKEQKEVRTEGVYSADLARQIKCVR